MNSSKNNTMWKSVEVVKSCLKGLMNSIPSDYCWKKDWSAEKPGLNCPTEDGWFTWGGSCWEPCDEGDKWTTGVCWKPCPSGWTDIGAVCTKKIKWWKWDFVAKETYKKDFFTVFNNKAGCKEDRWKFVGLCYKDCNKIGMKNCGIGACANAHMECFSSVGKMAVRTVVGIAEELLEAVEFVVNKVVNAVMSVEAIRDFVNDSKQKMAELGTKGVNAIWDKIKY